MKINRALLIKALVFAVLAVLVATKAAGLW
jgi:hypothetical protein